MVLEPSSEPAAPPRADVLLGVLGDPDPLAAGEAALRAQAQLREAFPARGAVAAVVAPGPEDGLPGAVLGAPGTGGPPVLRSGLGPEAGLHALLDAAVASGAPACALVEPLPRGPSSEWLRLLLAPILDGGFDLVCPSYRRGRLDGVLNAGVGYPLARALFGTRVRQPLGREIALSGRLAEELLNDQAWRTDPLHAGADLWVIAKAISRDSRICESFLGPRPRAPEAATDVAETLARVLGALFREMETHASRWQRVRASAAVPVFGDPRPPEEAVLRPDVAPLVDAFRLGWQDLRALWSAVLPPQTLLSLQRIPRDPPEAFRMGDALWAHIVYDFAVGWRVKVMDRWQLLRSMAPLYLGWAAGWANEVAPLDAAEAEQRQERLCAAFEAEKPYLISRWRWPDRFRP